MKIKRMNFAWPLVQRVGLTALPFRLFVAALQRHRRAWRWTPVPAAASPSAEPVP